MQYYNVSVVHAKKSSHDTYKSNLHGIEKFKHNPTIDTVEPFVSWALFAWNSLFFLCFWLQKVVLSHQPRMVFHPEAFNGLLSLAALEINYCGLQKMPPLHHISHSLEALNLAWNNISDSQVVINDDFAKLTILVLEGNLLTHIPFIKKIAANLVLLDLSHNSIDSLENIYNVQFLKLHALYLTYNSVRIISLSGLYIPKLYALHLSHNLLVTMEPVDEILHSFPGSYHQLLVYIGDNPWHCNESLSWLYDRKHYQRNNDNPAISYTSPSGKVSIIDVHTLLCHTPEAYRGKFITSLGKLLPADVKTSSSSSRVVFFYQ